MNLKSATKPFNVLLACTRPLVTELSDKLRPKHPLLPTTSYLTLKLETIHLHHKSHHSEVFAIDILDNLGGIHLRDAPTIDNVYRRCMKENSLVRVKNVTIDSFSCLEICMNKGIRITL